MIVRYEASGFSLKETLYFQAMKEAFEQARPRVATMHAPVTVLPWADVVATMLRHVFKALRHTLKAVPQTRPHDCRSERHLRGAFFHTHKVDGRNLP